MERYLLYDSGCGMCSKLAQDIEAVADGWLVARSLGDKAMQTLLKEVKPDWRWQPTLLEIEGTKVHIATGAALAAKMVIGLGLRRAWHITQLMHQVKEVPRGHTERRQFLLQSGALLAILPLLGIPKFRRDRVLSFGQDRTEWSRYRDSDFGFSLEHPSDWQIMTLIEQQQPYPEPEKIVRKYAFTGSGGYITLSIFLTQGLDLLTWLENQNRISPELFPAMVANAIVAGHPAVAFVTGDNLIVFVSDDEYVYRFWYPITDSTPALEAHWHMLDTFRTSEGVSVDPDTQIPQSVLDKAQGILGAAKNHAISSSCTAVQGDGCCEIPHLQACYRFPCSVQGGQHRGNCTYYVCYRYGGVPFSGDAGTWWGQVPTTPGWYSYSTPPNGTSIAWWGGGTGHVAYIQSYWGGGAPTFQEQNWCSDRDWPNEDCTTTRKSWAQGYIQKGPQPMIAPSQ